MRPAPHPATLEGTLYDPRLEHDSCGTGFVCEVDGVPSRRVVDLAIGALERLAHRGAVDTDGPDATGDGTGVLVQVPFAYLGAAAGIDRVAAARAGELGVGMLFMPRDRDREQLARAVEAPAGDLSLEVVGWREVPTRPEEIGRVARESCPQVWQVFLAPSDGVEGEELERRLLRLRRSLRRGASAGAEGLGGMYVPSLSSRTIVYKGMLVAGQLARFYPDLADRTFESAIAVFHQRFSTNTFPSWERAQPMRMLAHNGEINTLQGNVAWMRAREACLGTGAFGEDTSWLSPTIDDTSSDSGVLDNVLELLTLGGRGLPHAVSMLIPPAWEHADDMPQARRAFHAFHAGLMEPWDGPAAISFTDGRTVGAALDRTGLRPARWIRTSDGLVCCSSEAGSVPVDPRTVVHRGKLGPGQLLIVDTRRGVVVRDERIGEQLGSMRPWEQIVEASRVRLEDAAPAPAPEPIDAEELLARQAVAGYTREELTVVLRPMLASGEEPLGSMGDDTPHAALAAHPRPVTSFLRQRFAEVSNPAIDPIRERSTMTLTTLVGPRQPLLDAEPHPQMLVQLDGPVVTAPQLEQLRDACERVGHGVFEVDATFPLDAGADGLLAGIEQLCDRAEAAVRADAVVLVLADSAASAQRVAIPSLLAVGALHHHLIRTGLRTQVTLVVDAADVRDVHQLAALVGYGAEVVCPRLALDSVAAIATEPRARLEIEPDEAQRRYVHALEQGLRKVMSKMGIATVDSYCAGQVFEVVGLADEVVERCLAGTPSRLGGIGFRQLAEALLQRHAHVEPTLPTPGFFKFKRGGEHHAFNPTMVRQLHAAVEVDDVLGSGFDEGRELYRSYAESVATQPPVEPRDLVEVVGIGRTPIAVDDVEPARLILRRISTGAISHGAIATEAHEVLASAMNRLGGASNSGEGGESSTRFDTHRNSAIKQVASARFGVTPRYLQSARELQIKIAQGSKPGEGGHLPGHKVTAEIAEIRHTVEGVSLISPPPHHDIYSIEDLAQLVSDLRAANPLARISVKLVAQAGVGTIAAGVAKARADTIVIAGAAGGTGASPLSSIKHAGMPWEVGLAETQQVLRASDLRGRVRLRVDGGLRTGRDVLVAALLGADEVSFGTAALVAEGCLMARTCHNNQCPVGIATQRLDLRAKFPGTPERVMAYMRFVAEEVRELLAAMGVRSLDDVIGRSDALVQRTTGTSGDALDLSPMLAQPSVPDDWPRRHVATLRFGSEERTLDRSITAELWPVVEALDPAAAPGDPVRRTYAVSNEDRTLGAGLSGAIARFVPGAALPDGSFDITFNGSAGQSFGAFSIDGLRLRLVGEANDYAGKGLAGAELVLQPEPASRMAEQPHEHYVMGNTCLYGATSGRLFAAGRAGERFAVRNSGALAVVEGVGDHACEYMTGGEVVVLGRVGRNFGAGMTGGRAWVLDALDEPVEPCLNAEYVMCSDVGTAELERFWQLVELHHRRTGSARAAALLAGRADVSPLVRLVQPRTVAAPTVGKAALASAT